MMYNELINWVNTLPYWQRKSAEQIFEGRKFEESDYDKIYEIFKEEMGLCENTLIASPISFYEWSDAGKDESIVRWSGVRNIRGINALKSEESIDISPTLTLIYGENGSGKSGYVRLFNNAFISRGDKLLIQNIYSNNPEEEYAEFMFIKDGVELTLKYPDDKYMDEFKRIMVFDTKSATHDMVAESELGFVPTEFIFFDLLVKVCDEVSKRLKHEIDEKEQENPFLKFFERENNICDIVKGLSYQTDINDLWKYKLSDEEKQQKEKIIRQKAELIALNIQEKYRRLNIIKEEIRKIKQLIEAAEKLFSKEKLFELKKLIVDLKDAELIAQNEGIEQFKNDQIENVGSKEWKDFLIAAQNYYKSIGHEIEKCIFCGQNIDGLSVIDKYWVFLESFAEREVKTLKNTVKDKIEEYRNVLLDFLDDKNISGEWLFTKYTQEYILMKSGLDKLNHLRELILLSLDNGEWNSEIGEVHIVTSMISKANEDIEKEIELLNAEEISKKINELDYEEAVFKDREKLIQLLPQIEDYVKKIKWVFNAKQNKIKTNSITNKQKELFKKYITKDYVAAFNEECKRLNANFNAQIVQRGSKGTTIKKLVIKGNVPGNILSEGEQRVTAIANFLAEIRTNPNNLAIVFDDPVSSLDHMRRSDIAKRLVDEARERQVIIFTHDITFLMEMKTLCDDQKLDFSMLMIRKIRQQPGNISKAIPWQGMNVKERIKKLNVKLQELQKIEKLGEEDRYYYEVKIWCELLRESWERSVEEILLNDAIQRYNPCVQTQRLAKATFTIELYNEVEKGMTECSKWVHDRARALNSQTPSTDDLKDYLESFSNFVKCNRPKG